MSKQGDIRKFCLQGGGESEEKDNFVAVIFSSSAEPALYHSLLNMWMSHVT